MPLVVSLALKPKLEPSSVWNYCLKDQFVCRNRSRPSRSQRVFPQEDACFRDLPRDFPSRPIVRLWRQKPVFTNSNNFWFSCLALSLQQDPLKLHWLLTQTFCQNQRSLGPPWLLHLWFPVTFKQQLVNDKKALKHENTSELIFLIFWLFYEINERALTVKCECAQLQGMLVWVLTSQIITFPIHSKWTLILQRQAKCWLSLKFKIKRNIFLAIVILWHSWYWKGCIWCVSFWSLQRLYWDYTLKNELASDCDAIGVQFSIGRRTLLAATLLLIDGVPSENTNIYPMSKWFSRNYIWQTKQWLHGRPSNKDHLK